MSFRKPFQRPERARHGVRRARRAAFRQTIPALVESLEDRSLLSAVLPGLDDHGVIIGNAQAAGQGSIVVNSTSNAKLSDNAGGSGLFINLNNSNGQLNALKTIRITDVTVANNGNAGIQIRLADITLDRLEIDRAVITGNGGSGLVIVLSNANIGELVIFDSTNPPVANGVNPANTGGSRISGNAFDGVFVHANPLGVNDPSTVSNTIGTLRMAGNVVEDNAGNGAIFNLDRVTINTFDLFDNEVRANAGDGVRFNTNRTSLGVLAAQVARNTITGNTGGNAAVGHGPGNGLSFLAQSLERRPNGTVAATAAQSNFDFTAFNDNNFSNNAAAGVSVDLREKTTWDATLLRNTINNNGRLGFDLRAVDTENAINVQFGALTLNPQLQLVNGNTFAGNVGAAIALDLNDASGNLGNTTGRFRILGNTITGTVALAGSFVYRGEGVNITARGDVTRQNGASRFFNSVIDRNTVSGNAGDGIRLTASEDSELLNLTIGNDSGANQTFDVNGPGIAGGNTVGTRQGDGNVVTNNGGNGISVIRLSSAFVDNFRILDNRLNDNAEGLYLQVSNTFVTVPNAARHGTLANGTSIGVPTVNNFVVENNDISDNRLNGVHLRTEFDGVLQADLRYNRIDSNAVNGIRLTGVENNETDFEHIGGTWVKNAITNNAQNGVRIENVVGSANYSLGFAPGTAMIIGRDGIDRIDGQSLGNFIARNGEDGIEIGARPGAGNTQMPADDRDGLEIVNNQIIENGRNAVGSPYTAGKGIDIEVLQGQAREFRIDRNTISGNAGDGLELNNQGGLLRLTAVGNFIDFNGGRGVDLLNQVGQNDWTAETFIRFGDANTIVGGQTTAVNRNVISNNGLEGFYVVNTAAQSQTQDVSAETLLATTTDVDSISGRSVNLILDLENNEIRDNGGGVPQLNSPPSTLSGTGLVLRIGTQISASGISTAPDLTGADDWFTDTAQAGVGSNVIQGETTLDGGATPTRNIIVTPRANGRVNARVVDNEFSGNGGDDVYAESFTSLIPHTTAGEFTDQRFRVDHYDRDPLARLNMVFTGNTVESLDVTRGSNSNDNTNAGASFNNAEPDFKSRTPKPNSPNPDGPFVNPGAGRARNGQRVAILGFTTDTQLPTGRPDFYYDGLGPTTFRIEGSWRGSNTLTANQGGDTFDDQFADGLANSEFVTGADGTGYEWDDVATGTFSFLTAHINDVQVNETDGTATVTVTLTEDAPTGGLRIYWRTADGTAVADPDFDTKPGEGDYIPDGSSFVIAAGQRTATITVQVRFDDDDRAEHFFVDLYQMENALDPSFGASGDFVDSRGIVTVVSPPKIRVSDAVVVEGDSGQKEMVFTVTLSSASDSAVTVDYTTGGGTAAAGQDYTAAGGTLTFNPGVTSLEVRVPILGDLNPEGNETFNLTLSNQSAGALIDDATGVGTIVDNDTPTLTISDAVVNEGDVGQTRTATFILTLSKAVTFPVSVNFATANQTATAGQDYAARAGTITFAAGETTKTITVDILGDTLLESSERFLVNLSGGVNVNLPAQPAFGEIIDNDRPTITIGDAVVTEGNGPVTATFTVSLSKAVNVPVTVDFQTGDQTAIAGQDYVAASGTLTFNPGETSKTITVTVRGDAALEATETFVVNLTNAVNGNVSRQTGVGSIIDDDTPAITIEDAAVLENEGFAVFTVRLSRPLGTPVTVDYATRAGSASPGTDFVSQSGTLFFPAGETTQTIFIQINQDVVSEGIETFFIDLTNPTNGRLADATAAGRIVDGITTGLVVGPTAGGEPLVKIFDPRGDFVRIQFYAYHPTFTGGVQVAVGDVNGDGTIDVITAPASGAQPVRVFDGRSGALLRSFFAFPENTSFAGGISLAVADINRDGHTDIVVGIAGGAGPAVRVYDGRTGAELARYWAFAENTRFTGGINLATGDVNGDGRTEVIATIAGGAGPAVRVLDALSGSTVASFWAFAENTSFTGGVNVAAGDVDGDGNAEVIVAIAGGAGPVIRVLDGMTGATVNSFWAFPENTSFTGGVNVGVTDVNFDGRVEVLATPAGGAQATVRFIDPLTGQQTKFSQAYPADVVGGAFVAGQTFPTGQPLLLAGQALTGSAAAVGQTQVEQLAKAAAARLAAAGASAADLAKLAAVRITVADLSGAQLGLARAGSVVIDIDAAGRGWFVDATPDRDEEFSRGADGVYRAVAPRAAGKVDLLTVLTHELAHQLGLGDLDPALAPNSLMTATLPAAVRRATREHLDDLFAGGLAEELLSA